MKLTHRIQIILKSHVKIFCISKFSILRFYKTKLQIPKSFQSFVQKMVSKILIYFIDNIGAKLLREREVK